MNNRWNEHEARCCANDLELRVYSSRLLGQDPELVLHGGGNTSVKVQETNLLGETENLIYVKGSGWDLARIELAGFTPMRLQPLVRLSRLEHLTDLEMVNQLKIQQTRANAPTGSVEAILHAILPYRFVDHTHADAVVTLTNSPRGEAIVREIYGDELVIVPYVMPGFELAREVAQRFPAEAHAGTRGMILLNHGIFTFGDSAYEAYARMIELVSRAERYLQSCGAWTLPAPAAEPIDAAALARLPALRQALSRAAGKPMVLHLEASLEARAFARRADIASISQRGPATPDHVIRTKPWPMLGDQVLDYAARYHGYFQTHAPQARVPVQPLDPAPRVVLDPELGLLTAGTSVAEAQIGADIYRHTLRMIQRAERLGGWRPVSEADLFAVEYWELEQAKLKKGRAPLFQGEVALVTGGASGIGKACVTQLLELGATVIALDLDPGINGQQAHPGYLGLCCDITDQNALRQALRQTLEYCGGLDMLILNAGMFPGGTRVAELSDSLWQQVMDVNLNANLALLRLCHPVLKMAPRRGRVVVIGSKNVPAPGPGAAAYSCSKAALNQLARVVALEWAGDGININSVHPDAVFDTGIWTPEVLEARAAHYGMTLHQYKTKNLLKTEIGAADVAGLACALCGPLFAKTTGAQIPIDGGNDRVI